MTAQSVGRLRIGEPPLATILAYLELVRSPQVLIVAAGTFIGARVAGLGLADLTAVVVVALSNSSLFAASIAFNDWHDVAEDSINRPRRPLPSGRLSREAALIAAVVAFAVAVGVAATVDLRLAASAALVTLSSVVYSSRWKRVPLLGNSTVALISTYPLWCWAVTGARLSALYLALMTGCFLFRLGAEVVKTAEDIRGDRACGVMTLATARGAEFANRVGSSVMLLGLLLCWLLVRDARAFYTVCLTLSTLAVCAACLRAFLVCDPQGRSSPFLVVVGRFVMVVMVVALTLGAASGSV